MEREGAKEATARKMQAEDNATSNRLWLLLGCGKDLPSGGNQVNMNVAKTETKSMHTSKNEIMDR